MKNRWSDKDAKAWIIECNGRGINEELALRIYTARLLGQDKNLVLHGGGNVSLKSHLPDTFGMNREVMFIKGSGQELATIEEPGLPAVWLEPLRKLQVLEFLDDFMMVNVLRGNLIDSGAPNPSVETLLHAFLQYRVVDHTHASAILAISDQPNGDQICSEVFAGRANVVPYSRPGLSLAKEAINAASPNTDFKGLVLSRHGVVSFSDSVQSSYENMIDLVNLAESFINWGRRNIFPSIKLPSKVPSVSEIAPIIRGSITLVDEGSARENRRVLLEHRGSDEILNFVNGKDLKRYGLAGVTTPDHAIRTKGWPLILPTSADRKIISDALQSYADDYTAYYRRHALHDTTMLNPLPTVILMPGVGMFATGSTAMEASKVADIAENSISIVSAAEFYGGFQSISEEELFAIEYWCLEQAKIETKQNPPLAGHVTVISGGGGAIGAAVAQAFYAEGAAIVLLDIDSTISEEIAARVNGISITCDVTDTASVKAAFDKICESYGGIDILISNAGAAWQGKIGEVDDAVLRKSFEVNFFGHQNMAKASVSIMKKQGIGGSLLFNISKQAVNPGPEFGPYGIPKAATLALMRQYAVDYGGQGIRTNAVNADRIRSGLLTDDMITTRANARGIGKEEYLTANLLQQEVKAEDVAQAFVNLAKSDRTTGAILTVDGGNIAAALR